MCIIDILNKMADGTLEDGFKFEFRGETYTYNKNKNKLEDTEGYTISSTFQTEYLLTEEVEVIEDVKEIEPLYYNREKDGTYNLNTKAGVYPLGPVVLTILEKINELVQAVNELRKENNNESN